jgi:alpha-1,6-mannosyltransferase
VNRGATLAAATLTALLVAIGGLLASRDAPVSIALVPIAAAFVPYAFFLAFEPAGPRWLPLALAALASVVLIAAPPLLSDDVYRFLWDARVLAHGIDPYRYAPDDPALFALRDELWSRINHPEIPTIYPPLSQALFSIADAFAHHPASIKTLASVIHLSTAWLLSRTCSDARASWLYVLNPLALIESGMSGHLDAVVGAGLLVVLVAADRKNGWLAGAGVAVAIASKLVGLVALPVLARGSAFRWRAWLLAALAIATTAPLVTAGYGSDATSGLGNYSRRWRGNESAFAALEAASRAALSPFARSDHLHVDWLRPALEAVSDTALDPRAGLLAPKKEVPDVADFPIDLAANLLARVLAGFLLIAIAIAAARRFEPWRALRLTLLAVLLLAPQVHPWYLLWLLPIEIASSRVAAIYWSAAVLVSYTPLEAWLSSRVWTENTGARVFEYAVLFVALALELVRDEPGTRSVLSLPIEDRAGRSAPGGA